MHMQDTRKVTYYPSDIKDLEEWRKSLPFIKSRCGIEKHIEQLDGSWEFSQFWDTVTCPDCLAQRNDNEPNNQQTKVMGYPELLADYSSEPTQKSQNIIVRILNFCRLTKLFSWYN